MENKDLNRYEEQPSKENVFVKVLKMFLQYLRNLGYDFITSFKYNNMKLAGFLIAVPGVLFGFFLTSHAEVLSTLAYEYTLIDEATFTMVKKNFPGMPFDYTGIAVFALMLIGLLNIFGAASVIGKKNLGSVVLATVLSGLFVVIGIAYVYAIFYYKSICIPGYIAPQGQIPEGINAEFKWDYNTIMSLVTVIGSSVFSVAGCVLGFINYDRTYEKVNR